MKRAARTIQPTHRGPAPSNGVGTSTLLHYGESDICPPAVAPILVDIVRTVEEETFLQVGEQTSRDGTWYPASDTAPRQRARYAFD